MIHKKNLRLDRLVVFSGNSIAYDEKFHKGVNIIRGEGGSGKTSIAELIFFVLGGESIRWNDEHLKCDCVYAQINVNGETITLKREIADRIRIAIYVFWGDYEASSKSNQWMRFEYNRALERKSFSEFFLDALGIPKVIPEQASLITMHQVLRLLYEDQMTPTDTIFRSDSFDKVIVRETIGELLCGVYEEAVFRLRDEISGIVKERELLKTQYRQVSRVFAKANQSTNRSDIITVIDKKRVLRSEKVKELSMFVHDSKLNSIKSSKKDAEDLFRQSLIMKEKLTILDEKKGELLLEITDTEKFIREINKRVTNIEESLSFRKKVPTTFFSHCPLCLIGIDELNMAKACPISSEKSSVPEENYLRAGHEFSIQSKESNRILEKLNDRKKGIEIEYRQAYLEFETLQSKINVFVQVNQTEFEMKTSKISREIGSLDASINELEKLLTLVEIVEDIDKQSKLLDGKLKSLSEELDKLEKKGESRRDSITKNIKLRTSKFLGYDLDRQDAFKKKNEVIFDFSSDRISMDKVRQLAASSTSVLKSSFFLGLLDATLHDDEMNYPTFLLLDNIEDKGIEKVRSENFQKKIVDYFSSLNQDYQIIYTTSMIPNELNIPKYVVGSYYTAQNRSLKIR